MSQAFRPPPFFRRFNRLTINRCCAIVGYFYLLQLSVFPLKLDLTESILFFFSSGRNMFLLLTSEEDRGVAIAIGNPLVINIRLR